MKLSKPRSSLLIPPSISRVSHLLHSDGASPVFYDLDGSTLVTSPSLFYLLALYRLGAHVNSLMGRNVFFRF